MLAMVVGVFRLGRSSCAKLVRGRRNTTNRAATSRHRIEMWRIAPLSAALSVEGFESRPRGRPQEYTALDEFRARGEKTDELCELENGHFGVRTRCPFERAHSAG